MVVLWILALILALAPAAMLLWYIRHLDKYEPEPWRLIGVAFLAGCLSVIPAAVIETTLGAGRYTGFFGTLYTAFVVAGLTEEFCKGAFTFAAVWRRPQFNEIMDGIVYFGVGHMGFAVTENLKYVLLDSGGDVVTGLMTAFVRSTTAVPLHVIVGMIMGFHFGAARYMRWSLKRVEHLLAALALPVLLHGIYDVAALNQDPTKATDLLGLLSVGFGSALMYAAVAALWLILLPRVRDAQAASPWRPQRDASLPVAPVACPHCGSAYPLSANFCHWCGGPIPRAGRQGLREAPATR